MTPFRALMKGAEMAVALLQAGDAVLTAGRKLYRQWRPAQRHPGPADLKHIESQIKAATSGKTRK